MSNLERPIQKCPITIMSKFLLKNIQMSKQKCPIKNVQNENVQNKNENVQNDWNCTEKSTYDLRVRRWQLIVISMIALPKSICLPQILHLSSDGKNVKHLRLRRLRSHPNLATMKTDRHVKKARRHGRTDGRTDRWMDGQTDGQTDIDGKGN